MLTFLRKYRVYFVLLGASLIPFFLWTKGGHLVAGGDYFPPVFPLELIKSSRFNPFYIWTDKFSAGMPAGLGVTKIFPYLSFWAIFDFLRFDISTIQRLWFTFIFFLSGLSMHYLYSILFKKKAASLGGLVAGLFYMFNPYVGLWRTYLSDAAILSYIFAPIIFAVYIKGVRSKKFFNRYLFLFSILTTLLITSASNPQIYLVAFLPILAYTVFCLIFGGSKSRKKLVLFFLSCLFLSLLINCWWVISFVSSLFKFSLYRNISGKWVQETSGNTTFLNLFRFLGKWSFNEGFWMEGKLYYYYPQNAWYYLPHFIIAGFLMSILAFAASLLKSHRRTVLFLSIMALGSLFLARGIRPPFVSLSELFYIDLRGFVLFREPFAKFIPLIALVYAPMVGLVVEKIWDFLLRANQIAQKRVIAFFSVLTIVFLLVLNGISLISGDIFPEERGPAPGYHIKVPPYWNSASKKISKINDDAKILLTPQNLSYSVLYNWGYMGVDRTPMFIRKPLIVTYFGSGPSGYFDLPSSTILINLVYREMNKGNIDTALDLLRFLNTRYILHRNDLNWAALIGVGEEAGLPKRLKSLLDSNSNIDLKEQFGELSFYKISDQRFLPHFYIPESMIYLKGEQEILPNIISFKNYPVRLEVYVDENGDLESSEVNLLNRADEIFIKGEIEGEVYEKELRDIIIPDIESVFSVYVRQKPGGLVYPLVLKKEQLDEQRVKNDPEKLLDKKLFYASKRISEIEKWGEEMDIDKTLGRYRNKMKEAMELLKDDNWQDIRLIRKNILKTQVFIQTHWEKMIIKGFDEERREGIRSIFEELNEEIKNLKKRYDTSKLIYNFEIPKEGSYQLFIKNDEFSSYLKDAEFKLELIGGEIEIPFLPEEKKWIPAGSFELKKGEQELKLTKPRTTNLLGDSDWHSDLAESIFVKDKLITPTILEPAFPEEAVIYFKQVENYQENFLYKITFDYFAYGGEAGIGLIEDVGIVKRKLFFWERLPGTGDVVSYHLEKVFESSPDAKKAEFYFWAKAEESDSLKIRFNNVKIEKIVEPTIVLKTDQPQKPPQTPKISFIKINPTKYRVKVEKAGEPYTLVFSESFHKEWKAYIDKSQNDFEEISATYFDGEIKEGKHQNAFLDRNTFETWGKKPIPEERHLLANGYANSWYITSEDSDGQGNYEIIIEFWPQRLFYLGIGISLVSFFGCLGYLGYTLTKERVEKRK